MNGTDPFGAGYPAREWTRCAPVSRPTPVAQAVPQHFASHDIELHIDQAFCLGKRRGTALRALNCDWGKYFTVIGLRTDRLTAFSTLVQRDWRMRGRNREQNGYAEGVAPQWDDFRVQLEFYCDRRSFDRISQRTPSSLREAQILWQQQPGSIAGSRGNLRISAPVGAAGGSP
jgi:hypothetical protein